MIPAIPLALALLGPIEVQAASKPGLPPLAVLLGAEVEDLDRDLARQNEMVAISRRRLATAQRLGMRRIASADEIEQEAADARFQESRAAEMASVRDLKAHQRDVLAGAAPPDESKQYELVLAVLKSQEATARVEADFRGYRLRQSQTLQRRGVMAKYDRDTADVEASASRASVSLLKARQARLALEHARRRGAPAAERAEAPRLEVEYLRALVDHSQLAALVAHARLDLARDRARPTPPAPGEVDALEKAAAQADAVLSADRKRLASFVPDAPAP